MQFGQGGGESQTVNQTETGGDVHFFAGKYRSHGVNGGNQNRNGNQNLNRLLRNAKQIERADEQGERMPDGKSRHDFEQSKKAVSTAPDIPHPFARRTTR